MTQLVFLCFFFENGKILGCKNSASMDTSVGRGLYTSTPAVNNIREARSGREHLGVGHGAHSVISSRTTENLIGQTDSSLYDSSRRKLPSTFCCGPARMALCFVNKGGVVVQLQRLRNRNREPRSWCDRSHKMCITPTMLETAQRGLAPEAATGARAGGTVSVPRLLPSTSRVDWTTRQQQAHRGYPRHRP